MVNLNGSILPSGSNILEGNRAFLFGDGVFETVKIVDGRILYLEDHYFRLMSAMRIVRMEIPMTFTMEYLESQLLATSFAAGCSDSARARMTIYRNTGGYYKPLDNTVSFLITAEPQQSQTYKVESNLYEVDLYKDFYVTKQLLSSIKTTNRLLNITGSIFASENDLSNCILLNDQKNVVEALNGNLFMLTGNVLVTPPVSEGCLNGVMRKQVLEIGRKRSDLQIEEAVISPFDLQKADELFITNVIVGIQPISRYRKKDYGNKVANELLQQLNTRIRLF
ncbi:MAG TPA: aminotransferase class IV [Flavobacterium sp.]|jgi:branched-chain amino acid aminotransferase